MPNLLFSLETCSLCWLPLTAAAALYGIQWDVPKLKGMDHSQGPSASAAQFIHTQTSHAHFFWVYECLTTTQTQLYVLHLESTIQAEHANKIIQYELLKSFHQKTKSKRFSYTLAQGIGDFANCCISREVKLSQHLHESISPQGNQSGLPFK